MVLNQSSERAGQSTEQSTSVSSDRKEKADISKKFSSCHSMVRVKRAQNFDELCDAFHLVEKEYKRAGLSDGSRSGLRFSLLNLIPQISMTMIARVSGAISGTATIVRNSPAGLPCSRIYGDIIRDLTAHGRNVVEGTMLSCEDSGKVAANQISMELIAASIGYALDTGIDDFLLVVNPRHMRFWTEVVGLDLLGEERSCSHVQGKPGFLIRLDIAAIRRGTMEYTAGYQKFIAPFIYSSEELANKGFLDDSYLAAQDLEQLLLWEPSVIMKSTEEMFRQFYQGLNEDARELICMTA
ncbi:MAG: hypothetical protein PHC51_12865 [bacterium]|nr:hypothetical protein [bacterium]